MAIPKPTVWAYRNLVSANGKRLEWRISKNQTFKYGVDNPSDVIFVDDMIFPKEHFGKIGMEEFDEDGDGVPLSWNFGIADQFTFSGVLGDSTVISLQDLRDNHTSLTKWIIDDLSVDDAGNFANTWYVWLSWIAADGSIDEIFYSGTIDLKKITSTPFYSENLLSDTQNLLETVLFQTSTISDVLSQLYIQNLVENLTQADMFTTTRKAAYAGYKLSPTSPFPYVQNPTIIDDDHFLGRLLPAFNGGPGPIDQYGSNMAADIYDSYGDLNPFNLNVVFNDRTNVYGVKHGWQFVSYTTLFNKIATLGKFIFDASLTINPFSVFLPKYSYDATGLSDRYELSQIGDSYIPTALCRNYNTLFGVRPDDPLLPTINGSDSFVDSLGNLDRTANGFLDWANITGTAGSPLVFTIDKSVTFHVGQNVLLQFATVTNGGVFDAQNQNVYVSSVIDATHITLEYGEGVAGHANGTPVSGVSTGGGSYGTIAWVSEEWYDGLSTPITFQRDQTLLTFLVALCERFGYVMEWDIIQTGADMGKPSLIPRDILDCTDNAPTAWATAPKIQNGSSTQNTTLPKVAVKLTYKGDTTAVYCPRKPKIGELVIEREIMSRLKKWGEWEGYSRGNFIFDRSKDVNSQDPCNYKIITDTSSTVRKRRLDLSNEIGWLGLANDFYYFSGGTGVNNYNVPFANHYQGTSVTDQQGFYAASYEDYHFNPASAPTFDQINKDYFNTIVKKAIIMANALLVSKTEDVRIIRGIQDDSGSTRKLLRRLKTHWRDGFGNVIYKKGSKVYIDVLAETTTVHFIDTKADSSEYINLPYVIVNGDSSTGGGIGGGGISGGGGGGDTSNMLSKIPETNIRNTMSNGAGVELGLDVQSIGSQLLTVTLINTAGQNDDLVTEDSNVIGYYDQKIDSATGDYSITGFTGGIEDKWLRIWNDGIYNLTLKHETGSVSTNQIATTDGTDVAVLPGGYAEFVYRTDKWQLCNVYPETASDTHDVVTNPNVAHQNLVQATTTSAQGLEVKGFASSTVDTFNIQTSGGQKKFILDRFDKLSMYGELIINGLSSHTGFGLDTGSGTDFGTSGYLLTSGGAGGYMAWVNPTSIFDPTLFIEKTPAIGYNVIQGAANAVGLTIKKASGTVNILDLVVGTDTLVSVNAAANVLIGDVAGMSAGAACLYIREYVGGSGAVMIQASSATPGELIKFLDSSNNLLAKFDATANLSLGDMTTLPSTVASFNLTQFSNTQPGMILKQSVTPGSDNLQQWRDNADNVLAAISHKGLVIGGSAAGAYLDVQASVVNTGMVRLLTHGTWDIPREYTQTLVQTLNAAVTLLHNYTTANDKGYIVTGEIVARVTTGALAGKVASYNFTAVFQNIGGVLTQVAATTFITKDNIGNASTVTVGVGAVNVTDIEVNVTGVVANTIRWSLTHFTIAYV